MNETQLPYLSTLYLDGDVNFDSDGPASEVGGYGDVFTGTTYRDGRVALKRLRLRGSLEDRFVSRVASKCICYP
jgi:hypothetical protein